jgi:hypothetical protein
MEVEHGQVKNDRLLRRSLIIFRESSPSKFNQKAVIISDVIAHCESSLQTFNAVSGDQLYRYYRFLSYFISKPLEMGEDLVLIQSPHILLNTLKNTLV